MSAESRKENINSMMKKEIRIHSAVFYRSYGSNTVLYHTGQQKIFNFNGSAGEILDCFSQFRAVSDALGILRSKFEVNELTEFNESVIKFLTELLGKGILIEKYKQIETANSLEREVEDALAGRNSLYAATIELTYHCNERCRHCYIAGESRNELSTEEVKSLLALLCPFSCFLTKLA